MTKFGILSPPGNGHLNPMTSLGCELIERGHQVVVFSATDAESKINHTGLDFVAIGESEYPKGSEAKISEDLGKLSGIEAVKYTIELSKNIAFVTLKYTPKALLETNIEALLIDQSMLEGSTVAEVSGIPFVTICNALLLTPDPNIPPIITSWEYDPSWWGFLRNQFIYSVLGLFSSPIKKVIEDYRRQSNLPLVANPNFDDVINSRLAVIAQQPLEFDFPRTNIPPHYHFTGLFADSKYREVIDFPWNKLTEKPLIYASLGTVQNKLLWVFRSIARACSDLDVQLVISLGGSTEPNELGYLPGEPIVVKYAPQLELLQKATLCITHAGMNTTLESLSNGVPMVAIPIANDQPGIAARIKWTGTGEIVHLSELFNGLLDFKLTDAIVKVLNNNSYKQKAVQFQQSMQNSGGKNRAVDIIEQAIINRKPIYR